eukprot:NODE_735_length_4344_cov_1.300118.p3 type:complete len:166 gc:universal NODE_735_length_4344_cov_1.300118:1259-1756(+)
MQSFRTSNCNITGSATVDEQAKLKRAFGENANLGWEAKDAQRTQKKIKRASFYDLPRSHSLPSLYKYDELDDTKTKRIFSSGSEVNIGGLVSRGENRHLNVIKKQQIGKKSTQAAVMPNGDFGTAALYSVESDLHVFKISKKTSLPDKTVCRPKKRSFTLFGDIK